jgi:hypothetical protein
MIRTQISLTEQQMRDLRQLARRRGVSIAAAVRDAVDLELNRRGQDEARRRAAAAVGGFRSGLPDVGVRHDDYLAEDFLK